MLDEQTSHDHPALAELRAKLKDGLAQSRLNQKQLAARACLSRTTVSQALSTTAQAPSAATVAAAAKALKLPAKELLELLRIATGEPASAGTEEAGPGRPIGHWDPHELEVHPAGSGPATPGPEPAVRALPGYVPRAHDAVLASAVRDVMAGRSRIVMLVGSSSTGKTRACWEAVQPLAEQGWRLWHPFDPTRAEAALAEMRRVGRRTVVWLNEAQQYLGDPTTGEHVAAAVHRLLVDDERGPVLVLGTLWPEYATMYAALPSAGGRDPHSRVRELLAGHTHTVPEIFDAEALAAAEALAEEGDRLLADALTRARDGGRVTQDLAGAPELLRRYEQATPAARALLEAAMDARRLGVGFHIPQTFLTDATSDYLDQDDYDQLSDDWAERAYAELAHLVHGKQAPLRRTTPRPRRRPTAPTTAEAPAAPPPAGPMFRLADYLEQHGRTTRRRLCPPASFWHAAHTHLTHPDDLQKLAYAAEFRHRLQWAHHLQHRAVDHGDTTALYRPAKPQEGSRDRAGVEALYRLAARAGDTTALYRLAELRVKAGDRAGAEALAWRAADRGDFGLLHNLAELWDEAGDQEGAQALYRQAADRADAESLHRQAADQGYFSLLHVLAKLLEELGGRTGAEALYRKAADRGNRKGLIHLAVMREEAGDRAGAEALARQAADQGDPRVLILLAVMREEAGDRAGAEALARQAADQGNPFSNPFTFRVLWPHGLDPDGTPTPPWDPTTPGTPG